MEFKFNQKGISRLMKWGLPIAGLIIGGPVGMILGLIVASCFTISERKE